MFKIDKKLLKFTILRFFLKYNSKKILSQGFVEIGKCNKALCYYNTTDMVALITHIFRPKKTTIEMSNFMKTQHKKTMNYWRYDKLGHSKNYQKKKKILG